MNLKEAFRYQSFLRSTMTLISLKFMNQSVVLDKEIRHLKSKAKGILQDEIEHIPNERSADEDPNNLIPLLDFLVSERRKLSKAITEAKSRAEIDIDAEIETNKFRQIAIDSLKKMLDQKEGIEKSSGNSWTFTPEGIQINYYYDIETELKYHFDKQMVKDMILKFSEESDDISTKIETAMVNAKVEYEPPFNQNARFEDIVSDFLAINA